MGIEEQGRGRNLSRISLSLGVDSGLEQISSPEFEVLSPGPLKGEERAESDRRWGMGSAPLLSVQHLKVKASGGAELVRDVTFDVLAGEIMGLVGESGCGKSISALTVAGLLPAGIKVDSGRVQFAEKELTQLSPRERRALNGRDIGMVYQDALTALNPLMRVGRQMEEVLSTHTNMPKEERYRWTLQTMERVGLGNSAELYKRYPHELSGGQRQRVLLAMAIINRPKLLIADEPTTALDVVVQRQIIGLLKDINRRDGVSILFISHDIKTVKSLCDRLTVLYAGMTAESGPADRVLEEPSHFYTRMLLNAVLTPDRKGQRLAGLGGSLPHFRGEAEHCLFVDRCPGAQPICHRAVPPLQPLSVDGSHVAACFMAVTGKNEQEQNEPEGGPGQREVGDIHV